MRSLISAFGGLLVFLLMIYSFILIIRVILSWIVLPPSKLLYWIYKITDPVVFAAKKYFPIKFGLMDLSILVPLFAISLIQIIITDLMIDFNNITIFYLFKIIIQLFQMIVSFIIGSAFLFSLILLLAKLLVPYTYNPIITSIKSVMDPLILFISRYIKLRKRNADISYLIILMVSTLILWIIMYNIFSKIIDYFKLLNDNFHL